jgi:hypothetical protein
VTVKYLRDQRHVGTVDAVAKAKFPFPNEDARNLETILNIPKRIISAGTYEGQELYPDIVVVRQPGQWLQMMVEVEMDDSVTDERAENDWRPMSRLGDLLIYVPAGYANEAKQLCKEHNVRPKGIRTWRFRPVWGIEIHEA